MENSTPDFIKGAVESLLFISEKPVTLEQMKDALETVGITEIRNIISGLQKEYEESGRGMVIIEIAGGYQMLSSPRCVSYVRNFFKTRVKEKLSRPSLESLAIIAYKQPVSRADIEIIRGVNSDGVVNHLLSKGLIKIVGRKDIPGRPFLYGTTKLFLEYFGLKSLQDLPKLEEIPVLPMDSEEHKILPVDDADVQAAQEEAQATEAALPVPIEERLAGSVIAPQESDAESPLELKTALDDLTKDESAPEHDPSTMYPRASENPARENEGFSEGSEVRPQDH